MTVVLNEFVVSDIEDIENETTSTCKYDYCFYVVLQYNCIASVPYASIESRRKLIINHFTPEVSAMRVCLMCAYKVCRWPMHTILGLN